jgi:hypothetical protein
MKRAPYVESMVPEFVIVEDKDDPPGQGVVAGRRHLSTVI